MTTHKCNKEREIEKIVESSSKHSVELAEMKMATKELNTGLNRIEGKLDKFIDKADKTYATKEEVRLQFANAKLVDDNQTFLIEQNKTSVDSVKAWIAKYGSVALLSSYFVAKMFGVPLP